MPSSSEEVATRRLQLAVLQPLLGVEPLFLGEAAVMRGDVVIAEAIGDLARHPFGHAARVDEDQRRAMALDQLGQPVVDLRPRLPPTSPLRAARKEPRVARSRARQCPLSTIVHRSPASSGSRRTDEETRHLFDRLLRGRQADPMQPVAAQRAQPFQRQRQDATPRLLDAMAWISSTITVRVVFSIARPGLRAKQDVERLPAS